MKAAASIVMRTLLFLTVLALLSPGCGHWSQVEHQSGDPDAGSGGQDAGASDAGSGGQDAGSEDAGRSDAGSPTCDGRDFCECWQDSACRAISAGCLCHCDYQCPGEPACMCGCGGGDYLGCVSARCEPVNCQYGELMELDADGCPVCVPEECGGLGFCDCEAVQHCAPVTNIGFCACGMGCDPDEPVCDCIAPPFEPSYVGCADVACPPAPCDQTNEMFVMGADGCPTCAPIPPDPEPQP